MSFMIVRTGRIAIGVVLWMGGHQVLVGDITAGNLSAFIFYAVVTAGAAGATGTALVELYVAPPVTASSTSFNARATSFVVAGRRNARDDEHAHCRAGQGDGAALI